MNIQQRGFTLIELLVVISIIAILSSVVIASLSDAREKAQITSVKAELNAIRNAILLLNTDTGKMPGGYGVELCRHAGSDYADGNGLPLANSNTGLINYTASKFPGWNGPYLTETPTDPWGNGYIYDSYYTCSGGENDCASGGGTATVIHSGGPNESGANGYDSDNISLLICR